MLPFYIGSYIPLLSDFVEGHKLELMNKIICTVKLLHFVNNNNGIAKIDIIKVKLMTQLVFSMQKLYILSEKCLGYYT